MAGITSREAESSITRSDAPTLPAPASEKGPGDTRAIVRDRIGADNACSDPRRALAEHDDPRGDRYCGDLGGLEAAVITPPREQQDVRARGEERIDPSMPSIATTEPSAARSIAIWGETNPRPALRRGPRWRTGRSRAGRARGEEEALLPARGLPDDPRVSAHPDTKRTTERPVPSISRQTPPRYHRIRTCVSIANAGGVQWLETKSRGFGPRIPRRSHPRQPQYKDRSTCSWADRT
jgi:hypothetical protein